MSAPKLTLVPESAQTPGGRAILLMREARLAGEEQIASFLATLELVARQSREIIEGGEVYPAGVRDLCAKLAEDSGFRAQTIRSIMLGRTGTAPTLEGGGPELGPFPYSPAG